MTADDDNVPRIRGERQQVAVVLEQDDPLLLVGLAHRLVGCKVDRCAFWHRMIDRTGREQAVENSPCHVVEPRLRNAAGGDGGFERRAEILLVVERPARLLVKAVVRRLLGAVSRAPVAHHIAAQAEVALKHAVQEPVVLAGKVAIDLVVGAHDRARIAALDRELESEQVRHSRSRRIDPRIMPLTTRLEVVQTHNAWRSK